MRKIHKEMDPQMIKNDQMKGSQIGMAMMQLNLIISVSSGWHTFAILWREGGLIVETFETLPFAQTKHKAE